MARSFLFPGRDTEQLGPVERELETLFDRVDRPGNRITPAQFFRSPEFGQFLDSRFGSLSTQVPPGSQIISQTPFEVRFRDAEGFETTLNRSGVEAAGGQLSRQTNRPAVLPDTARQPFISDLQARLQQQLTAAPTLQQLDPETAAALQAISDAERARNQQQFQQQSGDLLARLFGSGVQRSSIATGATGELAQLQGLITQQQQGDAAARSIGLRQFLSGLQQQQAGLGADLFANLTGQGTQRDIASAGIGLDLKRLEEASRQFNRTNTLDTLRTQIEQERLDLQRGPLAKTLGISQIVANLAGAASGGISAVNALRTPRGGG